MANHFFLQENIHYIWERGIEIPRLKGRYHVMCMDGIAYAKKIRGSEVYEIIYPKMEEIDYDQQMRVLSHRGLERGTRIGYNDIMVVLGRIKQTLK